jgi:hypothetical protein
MGTRVRRWLRSNDAVVSASGDVATDAVGPALRLAGVLLGVRLDFFSDQLAAFRVQPTLTAASCAPSPRAPFAVACGPAAGQTHRPRPPQMGGMGGGTLVARQDDQHDPQGTTITPLTTTKRCIRPLRGKVNQMPHPDESNPVRQVQAASEHHRPPKRIGGLLVAYVIVLGILFIHGLGLTVAAVVVNANPSLGGLSEPLSWGYIAFYVVTNVILAAYTVVLMRLIFKKRKPAIVHNAVYAILTIIFLVIWHFLGMKSPLGAIIDSVPGLVGMLYFARSTRVKETLVVP